MKKKKKMKKNYTFYKFYFFIFEKLKFCVFLKVWY